MNKPLKPQKQLKALKLIKVGNSTGVILPREVLAHLRVEQGDKLFLTESPDGAYRLTPVDPEFERQMSAAEDIMKDDRDILRVLAK